jgi:hypothetical protein
MNALTIETTTTTMAVAPATTRSRPAARGRRGLLGKGLKLLGVGLFASAVAIGSLATTATPAAAMGSTAAPDIYGCFTWGGNVAYSRQDVNLVRYEASTGKWVVARTAKTTAAGCVRFNDLAVGRYFALRAFTAFGYPTCSYYESYTGYIYTQYANDYLFRLGTTYVNGPFASAVC